MALDNHLLGFSEMKYISVPIDIQSFFLKVYNHLRLVRIFEIILPNLFSFSGR